MKKETFEVDGVLYAVIEPKIQDGREAQKVYNKELASALASGGLFKRRIDSYMREQGLWSDEQEKQRLDLNRQLRDLELKLRGGNIKLSEGRKIALEISKTRMKLRELMAERNDMSINSVEGQAENARLNFLVSRCIVDNQTGKPVFNTVDEYLNKASSGDAVALQGANQFAVMMLGMDKDYDANLPENQFLLKWKFIDKDFHLVDNNGDWIDEDGRRLDKSGNYIDGKNHLVDIDGYPIDKNGEYIIEEEKPFLDDSGNPIVEDVVVEDIAVEKTVVEEVVNA
jgi:hypothetical protein